MGLNYNYKVRGWLNLTQGINYNEAWMDRDRNDTKWVRGNDWSTSTSANFTLYGLQNIPDFYVSTIRHIVTPNVSFNFNPGFPDNDKYYSFGGIGVNAGKKSRTINLSLDQKWQIKLRAKDNEKPVKIDNLFSMTSSTGLNLEKKEHQFGNLAHNFTFNPGSIEKGKIQLGYSAGFNIQHNPYKMHWLNYKPTSQNFTHTIGISGNAGYIDYFPRKNNDRFNAYLAKPDSISQPGQGNQVLGKQESWNVNITQSMSTDANILHPRNNNVNSSAEVKLTTNWSLSYSNIYNVTTSEMVSQSFDINRMLHCWKLSISYTRRSDYWDYKIVFLNVNLPDALKFQTRDSKRF